MSIINDINHYFWYSSWESQQKLEALKTSSDETSDVIETGQQQNGGHEGGGKAEIEQ